MKKEKSKNMMKFLKRIKSSFRNVVHQFMCMMYVYVSEMPSFDAYVKNCDFLAAQIEINRQLKHDRIY